MTDPEKGRRKGRGRAERDEVPNDETSWIADLRQARESGSDLGPRGRGSEAPPASSRWDVLGAELGPDAATADAPRQTTESPPREAARLQTFPDWFDWGRVTARTHLAAMIGNAVPPLMMVALGRAILPALSSGGVTP